MANEIYRFKHNRLMVALELVSCLLMLLVMVAFFRDSTIIFAAHLGAMVYIVYVGVIIFIVVEILALARSFSILSRNIKTLEKQNNEEQK